MNSQHTHTLSDEALSDLLAQPSNADSNDLNHAVLNDAEVLALKSALGSYRAESLAWAERRSATQPSLAPRTTSARWTAVPQWSLAAVAMVAVAAGVVHFAGYGAEDVPPAASVTITASATMKPDDIAADNILLGSIDKALRYNSVSPAAEFQPKLAKQSGRPTHTGVSD